jgi:hypothetical protein
MRDEQLSEYFRAFNKNATVHSMTQQGFSDREIIGVLALQIETLQGCIGELDAIAPRKIAMLDGTVTVWHCPDHLIPASRCS